MIKYSSPALAEGMKISWRPLLVATVVWWLHLDLYVMCLIKANIISLFVVQAEAGKLGHTSLGFQDGTSQCQCKIPASDRNENTCMIRKDPLDVLNSIPGLNVCSNSLSGLGYITPTSRYVLERRLGQGGFGETWLASYLNCSRGEHAVVPIHEDREVFSDSFCLDPQQNYSHYSSSAHDCQSSSSYGASFVIKRVMVERGSGVYISGLREKYFGEVFLNASYHDNKSVQHVVRYVQSLDCGAGGLWIVFQNEGASLSTLLYSMEGGQNVKLLQPSPYWYWLKTTDHGREEMRSLIWQLLMALKSCHDRSIIHRDIKPGNMVICFKDDTNIGCSERRPSGDKLHQTKMRIIDFGSAVDEFSKKYLYGLYGPSSSEQTYDYTPPEALLNASWFQGPTSTALKYDLWSVGVVVLEMILGSPDVFVLNRRSYASLVQQFASLDEDEMKLLCKLRSFVDTCITITGDSEIPMSWKEKILGGPLSVSSQCSEEFLSHLIKKRDPLELGFPNDLALELVRKLLTSNPEERFSVYDALHHPYFAP